jgi:hypothetical protein
MRQANDPRQGPESSGGDARHNFNLGLVLRTRLQRARNNRQNHCASEQSEPAKICVLRNAVHLRNFHTDGQGPCATSKEPDLAMRGFPKDGDLLHLPVILPFEFFHAGAGGDLTGCGIPQFEAVLATWQHKQHKCATRYGPPCRLKIYPHAAEAITSQPSMAPGGCPDAINRQT